MSLGVVGNLVCNGGLWRDSISSATLDLEKYGEGKHEGCAKAQVGHPQSSIVLPSPTVKKWRSLYANNIINLTQNFMPCP